MRVMLAASHSSVLSAAETPSASSTPRRAPRSGAVYRIQPPTVEAARSPPEALGETWIVATRARR